MGGFSSTLAGVDTSFLGLTLKKSPTRAEMRRPTLAALFFSSTYHIFVNDFTNKMGHAD